jgi:hypothetical protein
MSTPDIIGVLADEISADGENDSARLIHLYENGDQGDKEVINEVLICICGWTMESLLRMAADSERCVED